MQEVLHANKSGSDFDLLAHNVRQTFAARMGAYGPHLFATKSDGLSTTYVTGFPVDEQQHHNCNCCRDFIRRFGHAVFIDTDGSTIPALWDHTQAPEEYRAAIKALEDRVSKQGVREQFFTSESLWGRYETNGWAHFAVEPTAGTTAVVSELNIGGERHAANTGFDLVLKAIETFSLDVIKQAVHILSTEDRLNKPRDFTAQITWFYNAAKRIASAGDNVGKRRNLVRREVATLEASAWVHIANTVIGNLMEDIRDGLHIDSIVARFNKQTKSTVYQRTVAPPTEGNVEVARKIFAQLGLDESDLARRIAHLEELRPFWTPPAQPLVDDNKPKKLFEGLATKEAIDPVRQQVTQGGLITWHSFRESILPGALKVEAYIGHEAIPAVFFTNSVKPDAGRIFFYDQPEDRNTMAWYMHSTPVYARKIGLIDGTWVDVPCFSMLPVDWTGGNRIPGLGGAVMLLSGAREISGPGCCLFPQILRDDLREAQRVVEQFGNKTPMITEGGDAIGIRVNSPGAQTHVRVTTEFGTTQYQITNLT
jgi:hypothetical protein